MACEIGEAGDGRQFDGDTTVGALEKLIRQQSAVHIDDGRRVAGCVFGDDVGGNLGVSASNPQICRHEKTFGKRSRPECAF